MYERRQKKMESRIISFKRDIEKMPKGENRKELEDEVTKLQNSFIPIIDNPRAESQLIIDKEVSSIEAPVYLKYNNEIRKAEDKINKLSSERKINDYEKDVIIKEELKNNAPNIKPQIHSGDYGYTVKKEFGIRFYNDAIHKLFLGGIDSGHMNRRKEIFEKHRSNIENTIKIHNSRNQKINFDIQQKITQL